MSEEWAKDNGFIRMGYEEAESLPYRAFIDTRCYVGVDAQWERYGKVAGPIRNTKMVRLLQHLRDRGHDCVVTAFHEDLTKSKGTKNCFHQALDAGFAPVLVDGRRHPPAIS